MRLKGAEGAAEQGGRRAGALRLGRRRREGAAKDRNLLQHRRRKRSPAVAGGALRRGAPSSSSAPRPRPTAPRSSSGSPGLPRAAELHGNMTQAARLEALEAFRTGAASFLLATDVAARGLDVLGVEAVLNVDAPPDVASYLHRAGRTARAGREGAGVTLAGDGDRALLKKIVRSAGVKLSARARSRTPLCRFGATPSRAWSPT